MNSSIYYVIMIGYMLIITLIGQMDNKVQTDLLRRETEITAIRERSFLQIGWLTGFILLLLVISYIIIHLNTKRINRYKKETS